MLLRRTDLPLVVGVSYLVVHLLGAFSTSDDSADVLVLEVNDLETIRTFSTQRLHRVPQRVSEFTTYLTPCSCEGSPDA